MDVNRLNKKLKDNLYSEIKILKAIRHPHIAGLIDCKESKNHIYLFMEFCELGDLSYFIKKKDSMGLHDTMRDTIKKYPNPAGGGLNEVIVRHFMKQLTDAIHFLRDKDLIHRDVKPQNLLLNPSPHHYASTDPDLHPYKAHEQSFMPNVGVETLPSLKLADFGFARSLPTTSLAETLCGSPLYMAPEILRYEKYDARVDLWSIGTVLYEMMVGRPPFKAANHVDLLRKIEKNDDKIAFPPDLRVSDALKKLVRGLLKRHPNERMSFDDLFSNSTIVGEIPGLTPEDWALQVPRPPPKLQDRKSRESLPERSSSRSSNKLKTKSSSDSTRKQPLGEVPVEQETSTRQRPDRPPSAADDHASRRAAEAPSPTHVTMKSERRPSMRSRATAPAGRDLQGEEIINAAAATLERKASRNSLSAREQRARAQQIREQREKAAQDVAFERDYVVVEKRAVEVNALADEFAASPTIHGVHENRGALVRRATQQGPPGSSPNGTRALQGRKDTYPRDRSDERRRREGTSAASAISKAINKASGRLFGMGLSPPLGLTQPAVYSPYPAYPVDQSSMLVIEDHPRKSSVTHDEDSKTSQIIEENAVRGNVVYGFAEIKYQQLIPLAPSVADNELGLRTADEMDVQNTAGEEGLTPDAVVTLSEEALVLYVKALAVNAKAMDIAGIWWRRKNRGTVQELDATQTHRSSRASSSMKAGKNINSIVQWIRNRFNEILEKADFVRLKLLDAQRRLPLDHPSHPNNHPSPQSSISLTDQIIITPGVTAEKLMYDRALEMSRSAAVNELVGEDLEGCAMAYDTAIRMLEAVLEDDDEEEASKRALGGSDPERKLKPGESINGVEAEDRETVAKSKDALLSVSNVPPLKCSRYIF